ncbi:MAG: inositol monophosphatase [Planctomycetes bacterium]|nr:inositol monophosphatase [Planctomycetota bacterium]
MAIDHKDLKRFLEVAIVAARAAGQRALEDMNDTKTVNKTADELVTETDIICQQMIIDTIKAKFSNHGFVAEEGDGQAKIFKRPPVGDDIWWVIDPIDGTNNFARGIMSFCVSIGCIYQGKPVLGVVFDPCSDSLYAGVKDSPVQCNGRTMTIAAEGLEIFASVGIESVYVGGFPDWMGKLAEKVRYYSIGATALQLAYVAKGALVGNICHESSKLWDIAAGAFLIESAGGIVTDFAGKSLWPIDMNTYQGGTYQLLAGSPKAHAQLVGFPKSA